MSVIDVPSGDKRRAECSLSDYTGKTECLDLFPTKTCSPALASRAKLEEIGSLWSVP